MTAPKVLAVLIALIALSGCVSKSVTSNKVPAIKSSSEAVNEDLLLDVGITVFDPGLADYGEEEDDSAIYPEVRRAEAMYFPNKLAYALQESGSWGAVRVLPGEQQLSDLMVRGEILHSDGETLEIAITATDSRGVEWLRKSYTGTASGYAYKMTARSAQDAFQGIYNSIANDLLEQLESVPAKDRNEVRVVTELRFAQDFSSEAFGGYLGEGRDGDVEVLRLPAEQDPMLQRVRKIRERDHLFIDTLQEYYVNFDEAMTVPYNEWRRQSYEEVKAIRELRAEAVRNLVTGAIAVAGGIAARVEGDSSLTRAAGSIAVLGGAQLIKSGLYKRNETQIHVEALDELGSSLEAEIAPKIIELEDRTVTLSGNVEEQYAQWRELLAEIYRTEIGDLENLETPATAPDPDTL